MVRLSRTGPLASWQLLLGAMIAALLGAVLQACQGSQEPPPSPPCADTLAGNYYGLYVLNEGQAGQSTASLDVLQTDQLCRRAGVYQGLFEEPLGDVANQIVRQGDTLYVLVSGSKRLEVLLLPDLTGIGQLNLDLSPEFYPRELVLVSATEGYVASSEQGAEPGRVVRFNPQTLQVTGSLAVPAAPDHLTFLGGNVYISPGNYPGVFSEELAYFRPSPSATSQDVRRLELPASNPGRILPLPTGNAVLMIRGDLGTVRPNENGRLCLLNPQSASLTFQREVPGKLLGPAVVLPDGRLIFALYPSVVSPGQLYEWNPVTDALGPAVFTRSQLNLFSDDIIYSLAYDPLADRFYMGTYGREGSLSGLIHVFDRSGNVLSTVPAGEFPGELQLIRP